MKFNLFLGLLIFTLGCIFFVNQDEKKPKKGCVVILNGVSSSGKSTLQRLISNHRKKEFWLSFGFDYGVAKTVPPYSYSYDFSFSNPNFFCQNIRCDDINGPCVMLKYGKFGNQVIEGLHRAIKAYAQQGLNLAVDYLAYENHWAQDLEYCLKDIPHLWVKVYGETNKIIEREKNRPNAVIGLARPYMNLIHKGINYELEIDTTKLSTEETLKQLNSAIDKILK
jgi:chloramphenicol 3-O phosphotransferase